MGQPISYRPARAPVGTPDSQHTLPGRLARATLGALLGFVVVNAVVAAAVFYSPGRRVDAVLGNVSRPGLFVSGIEGYCVTRLNSMGLRAPEPAEARRFPERLLFLGDSVTEAYQVMDDETFVVGVAVSLSRLARQVACVNAGAAGAGPADYLYLAPALKKAYAPTRVIVQVGDTDFGPDLTSPRKAHWLEPQRGAWTVRSSEALPVGNWLREMGPPLLPAPYFIYQRRLKKAALEVSDARPSGSSVTTGAPDPNLVEWVVSRLREAYGSDVVILYLPSLDYLGDTTVPTGTETLVHRACNRVGVDFVDVRAAFSERYAQTRQPLNGFANTAPAVGHLNPDGHSVVASEVLRFLTLPDDGAGERHQGGD